MRRWGRASPNLNETTPLRARYLFKNIFLRKIIQMKFRVSNAVFSAIISVLLLAIIASAQNKQKSAPKPHTAEALTNLDANAKMKLPAGPNFEVLFAEGTKAQYVVLLHSEDRRFVQNLFHANQLDVMEAIITEAKKFGPTEEAVGGAKPLTTRFSDKQIPEFFVDVAKIGRQTRYYVTLKGSNGTLTVDAGGIKRGDQKNKDEESDTIFFDKLIERIQTAKQR